MFLHDAEVIKMVFRGEVYEGICGIEYPAGGGPPVVKVASVPRFHLILDGEKYDVVNAELHAELERSAILLYELRNYPDLLDKGIRLPDWSSHQISTKEVSTVLGYPPDELDRWAEHHAVPFIEEVNGKVFLWSQEDVNRFLNDPDGKK